jgi:hypothetical protein
MADQRRDVGVVLGHQDAAHARRQYTSPLSHAAAVGRGRIAG